MAGGRRRSTWVAAFVLAGAVLGALAAFVVRESTPLAPAARHRADGVSPALARSRRAARPPAEPRPTLGRPNDRPRRRPIRRRTSLAAFGRHVDAAIKDGADLLASLRRSGEAFDITAIERSQRRSDWAEHRVELAGRHPPGACYAHVHGDVRGRHRRLRGSGCHHGEVSRRTSRSRTTTSCSEPSDLAGSRDPASMQDAAGIRATGPSVRC